MSGERHRPLSLFAKEQITLAMVIIHHKATQCHSMPLLSSRFTKSPCTR